MVHKGIPNYEMGSKPKGCALVINISEYYNDKLKNREGTAADVYAVTHLWKDLGYEVFYKENLSAQGFKSELQNFTTMDKLKNVDSVIFFLMTHGRQSEVYQEDVWLYFSDGVAISSEWIINQFSTENCPILENKPKLFFFEACRGYREDGDLNLKHLERRTWPRLTDFLIVYPCSPGRYSTSEHTDGPKFVRTLCRIIRNYAKNTDIDTMLMKVDEAMQCDPNNIHGHYTLNVRQEFFCKNLYFKPGQYYDKKKTTVGMK